MRASRWGDNDRYFGPFTYARDSRGYRPIAAILGSGDGDDYPGCTLRLSAMGHTFITVLPAIIKPWRKWVDTSHYEWSKGSGGYWDTGKREYGLTLHDGHISVALGRVTNDSSTEQRWGWFLPWRAWRHVRHSLYDLDGALFVNLPQRPRGVRLGAAGFNNHWRASEALEAACPACVFAFKDFDGEELTATTRIEEREWLKGEGRFKWLSLFRRPKIRRSLDIHFSGETGRRKGSWKGGTIGHGIDTLPGELHEAAFRRHCAENDMTFVGLVADGRASDRVTADAEQERDGSGTNNTDPESAP